MRRLGGPLGRAAPSCPIRRARGYAPLPVALPFPVAPVLAAGADLKNACCVAEGGYAWLSQHLGDMDDLATLDALRRDRRPPASCSRASSRRARGRPAPGVPLLRLGPPPGRGAAGAHRPAPPRARRLGDGRARRHAGPHGDRRGPRRHRLRHRRRGVGWRAPADRLPGIPAVRPPRLRAAGGRRCQRRAALPDGPGAPAQRGCRVDARPRTRRGLPTRRGAGAGAAAGDRVRLRADLEHGPAVRRRLLAGRRTARRRLRGRGGDRAGGAGSRRRGGRALPLRPRRDRRDAWSPTPAR